MVHVVRVAQVFIIFLHCIFIFIFLSSYCDLCLILRVSLNGPFLIAPFGFIYRLFAAYVYLYITVRVNLKNLYRILLHTDLSFDQYTSL